MRIPEGPHDLTAGWLTDALRQGGVIHDAAVTSFQATPIGEGAGITGQVARVSLTYDQPEPVAPRSLILKLPSADAKMREAIRGFGMYMREVLFFREVAGRVALRTPDCYYWDLDDGWAVLLLEDLAPATSGQEWGKTIRAKVELAAAEVAKLHATWWQSPRLEEKPWLIGHDMVRLKRVYEAARQEYLDRWPRFVEIMGSRLSPELMRLCREAGENEADLVLDLMLDEPRTLIHNDFHLDNLFFASAGGGVPFAVVDWQLAAIGRGALDLAHLAGSAGIEATRTAHRRGVETYHAALTRHGVQDYALDRCWHDYRRGLLRYLAKIVNALPTLTRPGGHNKFTDIELPRRCAAVQAVGAEELLPSYFGSRSSAGRTTGSWDTDST